MKNIPYQLETEQAWWKDEKKNWEQLVNTAEYWLWCIESTLFWARLPYLQVCEWITKIVWSNGIGYC